MCVLAFVGWPGRFRKFRQRAIGPLEVEVEVVSARHAAAPLLASQLAVAVAGRTTAEPIGCSRLKLTPISSQSKANETPPSNSVLRGRGIPLAGSKRSSLLPRRRCRWICRHGAAPLRERGASRVRAAGGSSVNGRPPRPGRGRWNVNVPFLRRLRAKARASPVARERIGT